MMLRKKQMMVGGALVLSLLAASFGVGAATFEQGYDIGCDLGVTEVQPGDNYPLVLMTLAIAQIAEKESYYEGTLAGYQACRLGAPVVDVQSQALLTPKTPTLDGWVASIIPQGTTVWCEAGPDYVCAEFFQSGVKTLEGCCVHPDKFGYNDPNDCNGSATMVRDDVIE
jgi:hypothetical protein